MQSERLDLSINWTELEPDEIELRLRTFAEANGTVQSGFLDVQQWTHLAGRTEFSIAGGHANAQLRTVALGQEATVQAVRIELRHGQDGLRSVRQTRQWLERLGLPGQAIGDIVLGNHAVLALHPQVNPEVYGLHVLVLDGWEAPAATVQRVSAAALRADAIASSIFRVSREEAQTALKHGFVWRNFAAVTKQSSQLNAGDQLVFRTKGRAEILSLEANARSGRVWVSFKLYPC